MAQIIVTLALYLVLVIPMGTYLYHIAAGEKTFDLIVTPFLAMIGL